MQMFLFCFTCDSKLLPVR